MKNFDDFVGIDWTGAKTPVVTSSIAVSLCASGTSAPTLPNDKWSRGSVVDWIADLAKGKRRTLIGMDCNFGYAEEVGLKQFGETYDFQTLWNAVEEASEGEPNYFAGPYWEGNPKLFWMDGKKPNGFELPKRRTEHVCGQHGYGWPESPFKMIGPKQVGKGGLAGMRAAIELKKRCGDTVAIWPFEMELADTAKIVITEIYPRQFLRRAGHGNAKVRTQAELNAVLKAFNSDKMAVKDLSDHKADAIISAAGLRWLCGTEKTIPRNISYPPCHLATLRREGWIFGVGDVRQVEFL